MSPFPFILLAGAVQIAGGASFQSVSNPGFETLDASGSPTGWVPKSTFNQRFRFQAAAGRSGQAGHLFAVSSAGEPAAAGAISQKIDATPYRGKLVRFRAHLKVIKAGQQIGLGLRVIRPSPKSAGFADFMQDRPIPASEWASHEIVGRVADDALTLSIGLYVLGDVDVLIDDAVLETIEPNPGAPSKEAADYLMAAIDLIRTIHIDSAAANWSRIVENARKDIGGARMPRDTYGAIRGVLGALGEKHSFFIPASLAGLANSPTPTVQTSAQRLPTWKLVDGKFGLIRLPTLRPLGPEAESRGYVQALRSALRLMDRQPVCGWIIDLRGNGGGNMWPMLQGIDPLLGSAPFGSFVDPKGDAQIWQRIRGEVAPSEQSPHANPPSFRLSHEKAPVAVLIDDSTASAGEMVAVALTGRSRTRSFGQPSAGYATGNRPIKLSDGALLILTGVYIRDRKGTDYRDVIKPDVISANAQTAASQWLLSYCAQSQASSSMSQ